MKALISQIAREEEGGKSKSVHGFHMRGQEASAAPVRRLHQLGKSLRKKSRSVSNEAPAEEVTVSDLTDSSGSTRRHNSNMTFHKSQITIEDLRYKPESGAEFVP